MLADLGYISLLFAFFAAVYSAVAAWYGNRTGKTAWVASARNATIAIFFSDTPLQHDAGHFPAAR